MVIEKMDLEEIVEPLLGWYQKNKRNLPWRKNIHPYKTWVSEIMLQQTRVEAVKFYFERFMRRLPTIEDLAMVEEEELLKLWEGLGYYNRVRNMQKMAQIVVANYGGVIPSDYDSLLSLPGIGDYTAGAILSIAYQQKVPCVDGNVLRVVSRVTGSKKDITLTKTKQEMRGKLEHILPPNAGDFNQSLMELGALVCLPNGEPLCQNCPLKELCIANQRHLTSVIPVRKEKRKRKVEERTVFYITCQNKLMLEKRENKGLLASLYQLPNREGFLTEGEVKSEIEKMGLFVLSIEKGSVKKHIFTHVEWNMLLYKIEVANEGSYLFVTKEERETTYPLPSAFLKFDK